MLLLKLQNAVGWLWVQPTAHCLTGLSGSAAMAASAWVAELFPHLRACCCNEKHLDVCLSNNPKAVEIGWPGA